MGPESEISSSSLKNRPLIKIYSTYSRPGIGLGLSRGNVLASRAKIPGLKPAEVDGIFQDVKILSTSPHGGTLR